MAGIAGDPARVIRRYDLRKSLRLGAVGFVTACAHDGRIQFPRGHRCWIVGMLGQCSVTGLTRNHHMFTLFFLLDDVGVARLASLVAGEGNRACRSLSDRSPAIMAVFPKAMRDDRRSQNQEYGQQYYDDYGKSDEMFYVLEHVRHPEPEPGCDPEHKQALYFDTLGLSPQR